MKSTKIVIGVLCSLFSTIALAGPYTDQLSSCFADSTSGKDRKQFAKLMFVAMAEHPEMRSFAPISQKVKGEASQSAGLLITRLLTESCAAQARAAVQNEGSASFQGAFGILGQLAMQELLSAQEVNAALGSFEMYIDRAKVQSALAPK
ncbi:hypothetical protein [Thiobacillus sp.]|uniref:hypothetical protein n=1 Tax=Thiobacillus sp. TaxID=924 RepID=UPI00286D6E5E|nr:hypothetical protein [Thiobacillus sp.]